MRIILALLLLGSTAYASDITTAPELGIATSSDSLIGVDASAATGNKVRRVIFNGNATTTLSGAGTWITPVTANQTIDVFTFGGNTISLSLNGDGEATKTVDLSSLFQDADAVEIADSGSLITATSVEGALQENRTAINLNTAKTGVTVEEQNVQADWIESDTEDDAYILNKPTLGDAAALGATNGVIGDVVTWVDDGDGNASLPITAVSQIASGTAVLGTDAISSGACAATVTVEATGVLTTDVINWTFNADVAASASFVPAGNIVIPFPTADNVNFRVCNETAGSYTPPAGTINFQVMRLLAPVGE